MILLKSLNIPLSRPSGSSVIDQNTILTVLIHNLNTFGLRKFQCHIEFLGQFTLRCMHYFWEKCS